MQTSMIQTTALVKQYKSIAAVDHLDLNVPAGSIYGFLGPNGAGKTTTIRMLLGLIRPTAGEICVFGQRLPGSLPALLRKTGSLVEQPSFYPHLTGRENLQVLAYMRQGQAGWIERALKIVDLQRDANRPVKQYSQGMVQRLGLALALLGEPQLLVLDEPTNGLDPAGIHEIRDLIQRLPQEQGVTVFVSSHLLSEVEQMATCVGIIQKGRLIFEGAPQDLRTRFIPQLTIRVDAPGWAESVLAQAGWQAARAEDQLVCAVEDDEAAASINHRLVEAGLRVYDLHLTQPSLEDIFLQITAPQGAQEKTAA